MQQEELHLLSDAQVQKFICDGFLVLQPDVPAAVHSTIYDKLQWMLDEDYNPGNNILPRVPEMQRVLDAPEVRGALQSVLGADYVQQVRFCHSNFPGEETPEGPKIGEGSTTSIGWHQDSHSPLSRPRHHVPNYAMLLYYPQDTPPELGPTQLIPGTQFNRSFSDVDRARGIQVSGDAGTCVLVHFDVAHAGSLNVGAYCRHMVKFAFARVSEPKQPSWNCRNRQWQPPQNPLNPHDQRAVWKWVWNRLCGDGFATPERAAQSVDVQSLVAVLEGDADLEARLYACNELAELGSAAAPAVPALIASFSGPEPLRQNAIYALAAIGAAAVPALAEHVQTSRAGEWSEGAFVLEDSAYALAAMGPTALPALEIASRHPDEWVRINALFAIGEMGAAAVDALDLLRSALQDESHRVVRTALDALGQLGSAAAPSLSEVDALLQEERPNWDAPLRRNWSGADQVRVNAAMALLRMGPQIPGIEEMLLRALGDACGYVNGFAIEALLCLDSPSALRGALRHLRTHRWDDTLIRNVRTY